METNLTTGRTKRDDVGAPFIKAFLNVADLVHVSKLNSIMSSNAPRWIFRLKPTPRSKPEHFPSHCWIHHK